MDIANTEVNKFVNKWGRYLRQIVHDVKTEDFTDEGALNEQDIDLLTKELKLRLQLMEGVISKKDFLNATLLNHVVYHNESDEHSSDSNGPSDILLTSYGKGKTK